MTADLMSDVEKKDFAERYPTEPWDVLMSDFPYSSKESLQQKAFRLREEGIDVGYRKIRDRAQIEEREELDLKKEEAVDLGRMIDTDGWIGTTSSRGVRIGFSNKNKDLINHFENLASSRTNSGRKRTKNQARQWETVVHGLVDVYSILEAVNEHLIAKKEQAEVSMKYIESRCESLSNSSYQEKIPLTQKQKEMRNRLSELNRTG